MLWIQYRKSLKYTECISLGGATSLTEEVYARRVKLTKSARVALLTHFRIFAFTLKVTFTHLALSQLKYCSLWLSYIHVLVIT